MANVDFKVSHHFPYAAKAVWAEMIDWENHGEWIPATRVELDEGDTNVVGGTFTGYTGYGPLTLVDRMRVSVFDWDADSAEGICEVEKLGPVLDGRAGFTVKPDATGSTVEWFEAVSVKYLPRLLAPIVNKLSALGFAQGMKRLQKVMGKKGYAAA